METKKVYIRCSFDRWDVLNENFRVINNENIKSAGTLVEWINRNKYEIINAENFGDPHFSMLYQNIKETTVKKPHTGEPNKKQQTNEVRRIN